MINKIIIATVLLGLVMTLGCVSSEDSKKGAVQVNNGMIVCNTTPYETEIATLHSSMNELNSSVNKMQKAYQLRELQKRYNSELSSLTSDISAMGKLAASDYNINTTAGCNGYVTQLLKMQDLNSRYRIIYGKFLNEQNIIYETDACIQGNKRYQQLGVKLTDLESQVVSQWKSYCATGYYDTTSTVSDDIKKVTLDMQTIADNDPCIYE